MKLTLGEGVLLKLEFEGLGLTPAFIAGEWLKPGDIAEALPTDFGSLKRKLSTGRINSETPILSNVRILVNRKINKYTEIKIHRSKQ